MDASKCVVVQRRHKVCLVTADEIGQIFKSRLLTQSTFCSIHLGPFPPVSAIHRRFLLLNDRKRTLPDAAAEVASCAGLSDARGATQVLAGRGRQASDKRQGTKSRG
jgi:hypothetical protein